MGTSAVNLFDPQGNVRAVQPDQVDAAMQAGGHPAVKMYDPQGAPRWVRQEQVQDAVQAGGRIAGPDEPAAQQSQSIWQDFKDRIDAEKAKPLSQRLEEQASYDPLMSMNVGAVKGAGGTAAGILELADKYIIPKSMPGARQKAEATAAWLRQQTETHGFFQGAGSAVESGAELLAPELWMGKAAEAVKGMSYAERLAEMAKNAKLLEKYPGLEAALKTVVSAGKEGVKQGALTGAQGFVKSGGDVDAAEQDALVGGGVGAALGGGVEAFNQGRKLLGAAGEKIAPTMRQIEGVTYPELASEAVDEHGVATPAAKRAATYANIANEPAVRGQRQAAFKQMQTNLAKKGVGNVLGEANAAMGPDLGAPELRAGGVVPAEGTLKPDELQTALQDAKQKWMASEEGSDEEKALGAKYNDLNNQLNKPETGNWRYLPPQGPSLSPEEARSALHEIKQRWLESDWGPQQEKLFQQAHDDLRDQLSRYDQYQNSRPHFAPHDVPAAVNAVNSYGDAADHLRATAAQRLGVLDPEAQGTYRDLMQQHRDAWDNFTSARDPATKAEAFKAIGTANDQLNNFFKAPEVAGKMSRIEAAHALGQQRLASAFDALQSTMDKHFSLRADTAPQINRPRTAKSLGSLSEDIEKIKANYGDVLNPVLGDQGLNHIIELGDSIGSMGEGPDAAKGYPANVAMVLRRYLASVRGIGGLGLHAGGLAIAHSLGHLIGGSVGSLGALGAEGFYRMVMNKAATEPGFAQKLLYAAKYVPPRHGAPLLAGMIANAFRDQPHPSEDSNAGSK